MKVADLVSTIILRDSMLEKATGLMFKKDIAKTDTGYVFQFDSDRKIPIHMFCVFFPIDVIWVNKSKEIVDMKRNVLPFSLGVYHKGKASMLVEVPVGTIAKKKLKLMDKLEL